MWVRRALHATRWRSDPGRNLGRTGSSPQREADGEDGAAVGGVRGVDLAAVGADQGGDDRQAEAGAAVVAAAGALSRQKRSKTAFGSPGGRPGPWSRTRTVAPPSVASSEISIGVPSGVWTTALRSRLAKTRRRRRRRPVATGAVGVSVISRSGAAARASSRASSSSSRRSSGSRAGSRTSSIRASVRRSSTSPPIRADSASIRAIARSTSAGSRAAPIR